MTLNRPFSYMNILVLSFTCNLNWKLHIFSLAKTASMKLGVLSRLYQFYSSPQLLTLYRGLICPCMEYASHVWGGSTHTALLNRVESKAFRLINSSPLTVFSLFLIAAMLPLLLSFTAIFMLTALLILLTACLLCSHGLAAQDLPLPLTPTLSTSLMQELNSILSLSSLSLVNSGTLSFLLYFHLSMT